MIKKVKGIVAHPLFSGSAVMIVGNNLANAGQYLYHLIMGRLLGPVSYGELASIISLSALLGMVPFSLGLVVVKFVSSEKASSKAKNLITWVEKASFTFGVVVALLVFLASPFVSKFLQVGNYWLVALVGPMFLLGVVTYFNRASLQGLTRFGRFVSTLLGEVFLKLLASTLLVFLGYSVFGALAGAIIAGFLALYLSHRFIKDQLLGTVKRPSLKPLLKYAVPVLLMTTATTSFYSTDLILVKHFLEPYSAGLYASLSALGKVIFFAVAPVNAVMFPLVAKRQASGQSHRKIFLLSLLTAVLIASAILVIYLAFPEISIFVLFGSLYLPAAPFLFFFGAFVAILTIAMVFLNYHLSLGRTRVVALPLTAAFIQAVGIFLFHQSITQIISVSLLSVTLMLAGLLIYASYERYKGI